MNTAQLGQWWAQIRSVIRLEMKKTFFSKRGLWVYLIALSPVALFLGHSLVMLNERDRTLELAGGHPISKELLNSIESDMSKEQVLAKLGVGDFKDALLKLVQNHPNLKAHPGPRTIILQWRV